MSFIDDEDEENFNPDELSDEICVDKDCVDDDDDIEDDFEIEDEEENS